MGLEINHITGYTNENDEEARWEHESATSEARQEARKAEADGADE